MRLDSLDHPQIRHLLERAERVFRLETRQVYRRDEDRAPYAAHRSGGLPHPTLAVAAWICVLETGRRRGCVFERVHVAQEPLSPYLEFRWLWEVPYAVAAGEDVRIRTLPAGSRPDGLGDDFWLIDDTLLALEHDTHGRLLGADLLTSPSLIARAHVVRAEAMALATPFPDLAT
jgi:hypothetical protein